MTIDAQHPSRGKLQIPATHHTRTGLAAITDTSVNNTAAATPIVDALNRISVCATVPVHVHDDRQEQFFRYHVTHLDALTNPEARPGLLTGSHGFWYEHLKVLLQQA